MPTEASHSYVYPLAPAGGQQWPEPTPAGCLRVVARALEGMQKEALVIRHQDAPAWRIVCDEGPWLAGTDLAPFPLGYFSAGLAASYLEAFLQQARAKGIALDQVRLVLDTSDQEQRNRAPSAQDYLAAGLAFCFMTQVGRYAQISKQALQSYRILQDMQFERASQEAHSISCIATHLHLDTLEPEAVNKKLLSMSAQTCYLHAAFRAALKPHLLLQAFVE